MNQLRDPDAIIAAWLEDGPNDISADTRRAILNGLRVVPRRRSGPLGGIPMPLFMRLATAVVAVVAVISLALLNLPSPGPEPGVIATPSVSASPTVPADSHLLKPGGADTVPPIVVTVPDGWSLLCANGCNAVTAGASGLPALVAYFTVDNVYAEPCRHILRDPPIGSSVDDLANALATLPGTDAVQPVATTLGGYTGKYVELAVREDSGCGPGSFYLFDAGSTASHSDGNPNLFGWTRWLEGSGQRFRFWILDVDGQRVLIEASSIPEATPAQVTELSEIVESIRFGQ